MRHVLLVAAMDLAEAWRSRRTLAFLGMYVVLALSGTWAFLAVLLQAEQATARAMGVPEPTRPGTLLDAVIDAGQADMMAPAFGGVESARAMLALPPVAVFTFWLSLQLVPLLVVLTCHDAASSDLARGTARYALVRVPRARWALGRLLGHAALTSLALAAALLASILLAAWRMEAFDSGATILWSLRLLGRTLALAFAWLGAVVGISLAIRSTWMARTASFGLLLAGGGGRWLLEARPVQALWPHLSAFLLPLFPGHHVVALYRPEFAERLAAMFMLAVLGGLGFCAGVAVLLWRDA